MRKCERRLRSLKPEHRDHDCRRRRFDASKPLRHGEEKYRQRKKL